MLRLNQTNFKLIIAVDVGHCAEIVQAAHIAANTAGSLMVINQGWQ